jgi:hypothetical protein
MEGAIGPSENHDRFLGRRSGSALRTGGLFLEGRVFFGGGGGALAADAMGTPRTVFDFFRGEGFYLSVFALLMTVLCWQVGNLGRHDPASAR